MSRAMLSALPPRSQTNIPNVAVAPARSASVIDSTKADMYRERRCPAHAQANLRAAYNCKADAPKAAAMTIKSMMEATAEAFMSRVQGRVVRAEDEGEERYH